MKLFKYPSDLHQIIITVDAVVRHCDVLTLLLRNCCVSDGFLSSTSIIDRGNRNSGIGSTIVE